MSAKRGCDEQLSVTTPEKLTVFYLNKDIMMINNCTKFVLIAGIGLSLFSGLSQAAVDQEDSLMIVGPGVTAPSRLGLGTFALIHDTEGFSVFETNGKKSRVQNRLVDKSLRGIPQSEVKAGLNNHINFRVQQESDGEFSLQEGGGLDGGLGLGQQICYWTAKGLGYIGLVAVVEATAAVGARTADPRSPGNSPATNAEVTSVVTTGIIANSGVSAAIETAAAGMAFPYLYE